MFAGRGQTVVGFSRSLGNAARRVGIKAGSEDAELSEPPEVAARVLYSQNDFSSVLKVLQNR